MATIEYKDSDNSYRLSASSVAGIVFVSVVYFADILLKARYKCFWFDELFTTYLCRLPDFKSTWAAVTHGADFNPPLLYLFTRGAQWLFGEGLIATRLPAMIGFWGFGFCLFLFVARRAGAIAGFIAGAFPFFTLAQYYAYEARAHGIVLGWCGLSLVCWQRRAEGPAKHLWLVGFGLCLAGALLTHVYAVYLFVPFAVAELYNLLKKTRIDWGVAAVLVFAPAFVIATVYLPLMRGYRAAIPATFFPVSHYVLQRFLVNAIGPAIGILIFWLLLLAVDGRRGKNLHATATIPQREIVLAAAFLCVPIIGLVGCKVSHGPFLDRYFLSSIAGVSILLGFANARLQTKAWLPKILAGSMLFLALSDLGTSIYLGMKHRTVLFEPSTGLRLSTDPADPMALYKTFSMRQGDQDILILSSLDYFYLFRYAPPSIISHLYFGSPTTDVNRGGYEKLAKWAHISPQIVTVNQFLTTHEKFLLYENGSSLHIEQVRSILGAGYKLTSAKTDAVGIMYEYAK